MFADAVRPPHGARPVGCWAPKEVKVAVDQTSGRERVNIHGAVDCGNRQHPHDRGGDGQRPEAPINLLIAIEFLYPAMRIIHVFLDDARYHHARAI